MHRYPKPPQGIAPTDRKSLVNTNATNWTTDWVRPTLSAPCDGSTAGSRGLGAQTTITMLGRNLSSKARPCSSTPYHQFPVSTYRARRFSIARSWRELWRRGRRGRRVSSACPCPARETHLETLRARRIRIRKVFLDRDVRCVQFPLTYGH
jgi:hypothetical protein